MDKKRNVGKVNKEIIITPKQISDIMSVSIQTAYKIVRELNNELEEVNKKRKENGEEPYIIFTSKTYTKYFSDRFYGKKFLKIKEVKEKLGLKYWEAQEICSQVKSELIKQGYKFIKGRIPEEYLKIKFIQVN